MGATGALPSPSVYDEHEDRVEELTNAVSPVAGNVTTMPMGMMGMPVPGGKSPYGLPLECDADHLWL